MLPVLQLIVRSAYRRPEWRLEQPGLAHSPCRRESAQPVPRGSVSHTGHKSCSHLLALPHCGEKTHARSLHVRTEMMEGLPIVVAMARSEANSEAGAEEA